MSLAPGTRIGPYEVVSMLGAGGMGEVYRARDSRLKRDVAIKVLPEPYAADTDRRARIEREAQVLAALNQSNIAQIHGVEEIGLAPALIMEYVDGETLAERIARSAIPLSEALGLAAQIATALDAAHAAGIIHRDLKPANIKITPAGHVKVLDFGLAKAFEGQNSLAPNVANCPTITNPSTQLGVILGTAAYMAPEQAKGRAVDKRADIWAFGCVLFEMLSSRRAFVGDTVSETVARILEREPDWTALPAETSPAIRTLLARCLRKDPRKRVHDVADVLIELEDAQAMGAAAPLSAMRDVPIAKQFDERLWWRTAPGIAALMVITAVVSAGSVALINRESTIAPVPIATAVLPPSGVTFDFSEDFRFGPMTLSPDGRQLVFSSLKPDGRIGLFIRSLSGTETRELAGTEGGVYPFWSPDSRFVAFYADQKLKKIALADGAVADIAGGVASTGGRGGTWSADGTILFVPGYFTAVKKVSAAGGAVSDATTLDATRGEMTNRFPWFLPDGRHFLYTAQNTTAFFNRSTIRLGSLDSPSTSEVIGEAESNAIYATGYLLYVRENTSTLVAQPFDLKALKITGEPLTVVDGVRTVMVTSCGIFSASNNGLLVYQKRVATSFGRLMWLDRSKNRRMGPVINATTNVGDIHFSPDRRYATANIQSASGRGSDVWIYDVSRGVLTPFTSDGRLKRAAVWSPDGKTIVFDASRDATGGPQNLYRMPSDSSREPELLLASDVNKRAVGFSSDGRFLAYVTGNALTGYDLFVLPDPLASKPGNPVPLAATPANEQYAQFAPRGDGVIYASTQSGRYEIWFQPFPRPGGRQQVSVGGGQLPRWRRDGKEIFYVGPDQQLMAVDVQIENGTLRARTPRPAGAAKLRSSGFFTYDVSADGEQFLAVVTGNENAAEPLTLLQNWTTRLASQELR